MAHVPQICGQAESPIPYRSILFPGDELHSGIFSYENSEVAHDLNLDQIVENITNGYEEYELKPLFYKPLATVDDISFRQEVMDDIHNEANAAHIRLFAARMKVIREILSLRDRIHHDLQKRIRLLEAACHYCSALSRLSGDLCRSDLHSRGLIAFRGYLANYIESAFFRSLTTQAESVKQGLDNVKYSLEIYGRRVRVSPYKKHRDFGADVRKTFEKFQEVEGKHYNFEFRSHVEMNHVEAAILDRVARLHPKEFAALGDFSDHHAEFMDDLIRRFDREIHFYIACVSYVKRLVSAKHSFCYPAIVTQGKGVFALQAFDIALADQLMKEKKKVVANSFELEGHERVLVVSGPNQGGKTTFARMFGQIHYLAALGCQVPGHKARLLLFDRMFTHFEREENVLNLAGKLEDDLLRIHQILLAASSKSILIMNESLLSTTLEDALFLSQKILQQVIQKGLLCVTVTFLDELASFGPETVSMVSEIDPGDSTRRTYQVVRKPADGRAYAVAIAEKYGLSYSSIKSRMHA